MIKKHQLKKSWIWNKPVEDLVKSKIKGYSLNVPCGDSKLGDEKGDLEPINKSIVRMNMRDLPFLDNVFDTVISDPPWKLNFFHRQKPFFECVRVCKIGGRIIYNALWIPTSKCVELEETIIRQDKNWCNVSIISIFKKIKDVPKK